MLNELVWQELSPVEWRFVESQKADISLPESHNESIRRQPPYHIIESADLRDTARAQICGVWEGCGAEIGAM